MTSISIQGVSKSYGAVSVLKGLDLAIGDGEFISVLGPSGCGKSTMLFCIAGLEAITRARILFDDRDVSDLAPRARNIALVFQDYALYPAYGVRLAGELALIEPAGPVHDLDVQVGAMMIKATCADPTGLRPGAPLTLSAPAHSLHVFDRDSGVRLAS